MQNLDPQIVALTKAIGHEESGGNYTQPGDNGHSYGAYQWNNGNTPISKGQAPVNWQTDASKYLGQGDYSTVDSMTKENQDKVAYSKVSDLASQGYKPAQIASIWNTGSPDKYKTMGKGYNAAQGVNYDPSTYVNNVAKYYKQFGGDSVQTPSTSQQPSNADDASNPQGLTTDLNTGNDRPANPLGDTVNNALQSQPGENLITGGLRLAGRVGEGLVGLGRDVVGDAGQAIMNPQQAGTDLQTFLQKQGRHDVSNNGNDSLANLYQTTLGSEGATNLVEQGAAALGGQPLDMNNQPRPFDAKQAEGSAINTVAGIGAAFVPGGSALRAAALGGLSNTGMTLGTNIQENKPTSLNQLGESFAGGAMVGGGLHSILPGEINTPSGRGSVYDSYKNKLGDLIDDTPSKKQNRVKLNGDSLGAITDDSLQSKTPVAEIITNSFGKDVQDPTALQNVMRDNIERVSGQLDDALRQYSEANGKDINLKDIQQKAIEKLSNTDVNYTGVKSDIENIINDNIQKLGAKIDLSQANEIKSSAYKESSSFDQKGGKAKLYDNNAYDKISSTIKDLIEEQVTDEKVKELNRYIGDRIQGIQQLEALRGKPVKVPKLTRGQNALRYGLDVGVGGGAALGASALGLPGLETLAGGGAAALTEKVVKGMQEKNVRNLYQPPNITPPSFNSPVLSGIAKQVEQLTKTKEASNVTKSAQSVIQKVTPEIKNNIVNKIAKQKNLFDFSKVELENKMESKSENRTDSYDRILDGWSKGKITPIELVKTGDGKFFIENGRHKHSLLEGLGINKYPVTIRN